MRASKFCFITFLVLASFSLPAIAQNVDVNATEVLPDAPTPMLLAEESSSSSNLISEGFMTKAPASSPVKHHERAIVRWSSWGSDAFLLGSLRWDMQTTDAFMHHKTKVRYFISCSDYIKAYPTFPCGVSGPIVGAWNLDPALFYEGGWAKTFGRNNSTAVIAANSIRGVAVVVIGRMLSRHGSERKKWIVVSVNCYLGLVHLLAAENNARFIHQTDQYYVPQGAYDVHWSN